MSIEYYIWFNYCLKALEMMNLPITLGGTSNHFKIEELKAIGAWDAYNVTEDAELGIRIYTRGFKTEVIDSYTLEEAPISITSWLKQRSRWIKGFIQTFLVYVHYRNDDKQYLPLKARLSVWLLLGFNSFYFFFIPYFICMGLTKSMRITSIISFLIYILTSYSIVRVIFLRHYKGKHFLKYCIALVTFPLYSIFHIIASYIAVFELLINPFKWNKTTHGVTKMFHRKVKRQ